MRIYQIIRTNYPRINNLRSENEGKRKLLGIEASDFLRESTFMKMAFRKKPTKARRCFNIRSIFKKRKIKWVVWITSIIMEINQMHEEIFKPKAFMKLEKEQLITLFLYVIILQMGNQMSTASFVYLWRHFQVNGFI